MEQTLLGGAKQEDKKKWAESGGQEIPSEHNWMSPCGPFPPEDVPVYEFFSLLQIKEMGKNMEYRLWYFQFCNWKL